MKEKLKQEKEILLKRISEIDAELQKRTPEQFKTNQWENILLHPNWRLKTINNK